MDAELRRRQAEYERANVGRVPHLREDVTEAQLDGRACIRCGAEYETKRPIAGSSVLSSQLFVCVDREACDRRLAWES